MVESKLDPHAAAMMIGLEVNHPITDPDWERLDQRGPLSTRWAWGWMSPDEHVLVGLDAESDDDFLIAYALTTSPPSGWYDQESMSVPPEFVAEHGEIMDENGEMIRGKLNFVIFTMKLDIKNRLREISRKRIKKTPDESVQSPPICPSCNAELSIGANFCQICGAKLD